MFDFLKFRSASPIDRLVRRLTETGGEDGPRIEAAEKLAEMDTPEATFALAKRFTMSSKVITQDIEEKRMVVQMLAGKGEEAVDPILRFLKSFHQVEWPVRALAQILPTEQLVPKLVDVLEKVAQNPFTSPEHRTSLIKAMQGHVTPEIAAALKNNEISLAADQIKLEGPLKELGLYTVKIRLASEVEGELKVWVVPAVQTDAK